MGTVEKGYKKNREEYSQYKKEMLEILENDYKKLKNEQRLLKIQMKCLKNGYTFFELCRMLEIKEYILTDMFLKEKLTVNTIFNIQKILSLSNEEMSKIFFKDRGNI